MSINVKIDDVVVPRIRLGKVVKVTSEEVQMEWKDDKGDLRYSSLTRQQADLRGLNFEEMVNSALIKLEGVEY
jgi:hypothetical protein